MASWSSSGSRAAAFVHLDGKIHGETNQPSDGTPFLVTVSRSLSPKPEVAFDASQQGNVQVAGAWFQPTYQCSSTCRCSTS